MCGAAALMIGGFAAAQEVANDTVQAVDECLESNDCVIVADLRLETIDVAGLRPVPEADISSALTVLDASDLAVRNSPYIADQLRAVPGVGVSNSGGPGALSQVRIRGAEANHTLVLIDGIEFSDPANGETDFGILSALNTSRIEVLRGEQSALYGSDAVGGVINVVTDDMPFASGALEFGSYGTARGQAANGVELGPISFSGAFSGYVTDGVDTSGTGGDEDGSEALTGLVRAGVDIGDTWNISALASVRSSEVDIDSDTDFDGLLNDTLGRTESQQQIYGVAVQGETGSVDHVFRANYNEVERENSDGGTFQNRVTGERTKVSYSPSIQWDARGSQTISGLIEYEDEGYERVDTNTLFGDPNQDVTFESVGTALEYRMDWGNVLFDASFRYDFNSMERARDFFYPLDRSSRDNPDDDGFDDAFTRQFGAAYAFDSIGGRIRGGYGTGVKNPTFTELFGFFPGSFIGNPDLEPEESESIELGWDQNIGDFDASLTAFYAELENEIFTAFTPTFQSTAQNRDEQSTRGGVEFAAVWEPTSSLTMNGAASYIISEFEEPGTGRVRDEIRVPTTTASLGASWTPEQWDGFRVSGALDYVGEQDDFNFGTFPAARATLDSYVLASASAEVPVTENIAITLRGENLFDEDATDVFGYAKPGAAVFVGLKIR